MPPTKWDLTKERTSEFFGNIWELWEISNTDQRWFLVTLIGIVVILSTLIIRHVHWRIVNRVEIRKVKHFSNVRRYLETTNKETAKGDQALHAVCKLSQRTSRNGTGSPT